MRPPRAPPAALAALATLAATWVMPAAAATPAPAPPAATTVTVTDAWIRATPGSDVAAAYLTLRNTGAQPVVITGVRTPRAGHAMIHESVLADGQSRMRPRDTLRLEPGATLRLAPGGLHIMLGMLASPLAPGQDVPLELLIEGGGTLAVSARVRAPGAP